MVFAFSVLEGDEVGGVDEDTADKIRVTVTVLDAGVMPVTVGDVMIVAAGEVAVGFGEYDPLIVASGNPVTKRRRQSQ